ncbi:hypothetical protein [Photorhabdus sp. RM323S]|uniref:immunity protein TriTu family protein n=1 Tax=Photorhabdus sp. RM323S TaxID=3342828 RepID=UPI0036DCE7AD
MLVNFENWLREHENYKFVINNNELSDSLIIDIDEENCLARFTLWDDLSCMSEVINVSTGQYMLDKREEFNNLEELLIIFKEFTKAVSSLLP